MDVVVCDGNVVYVKTIEMEARAGSCKHHAMSITCLIMLRAKGTLPSSHACARVNGRWVQHIGDIGFVVR